MTDVTKAAPLLAHEERERLELRVQQAVAQFVDRPRAAVEEVDHVVEDLVGRFTDAMARRRRTLRTSWQAEDGSTEGAGRTETADTERLRLALRDYRELAERLLRV
jgi:hypothetical protein